MHNLWYVIIFFKNHLLLKITFWLLRSIWLPGVHCILVLLFYVFSSELLVLTFFIWINQYSLQSWNFLWDAYGTNLITFSANFECYHSLVLDDEGELLSTFQKIASSTTDLIETCAFEPQRKSNMWCGLSVLTARI